ncbi:MAG: hypothetical protein N2559_06620, partial [Anaerolineae bacterium]|nr:hypothetical protein [Anaerolineae bacterium]
LARLRWHLASYRDERDQLEAQFIADAFACPPAQRAELSARCFRQADEAEARWLARLDRRKPYPDILYARAWQQFDAQARM